MNKSGITRRIDELGRIVVPKEMRYNLGIRDGEPLEIFIEDNSIVIRKYSQVENIKDISLSICSIMSEACNIDMLISDREKIIAASSNLKDLINHPLDKYHKELIDNRESFISKDIIKLYSINNYFTILPIITSTDCSGLIFIISKDNSDVNQKYAKIVQKLIVKKLDIV